MKSIYLVQRCLLKTDELSENKRFSENLDCDYMGASEFEFGALPKSLRAMNENEGYSVVKSTKIFDLKGHPLRIYSNLNVIDVLVYESWLDDIYNGKVGNQYFKESPRFSNEILKTNSPNYYPVLWWDIKNHVMWTFNKKIASILKGSIKQSVDYMDELKKK